MSRAALTAVALLIATPAVAQEQSPAPAPAQEFCSVLTQSGDTTSLIPMPGYSVLAAAARPLPPPPGQAIGQFNALVCIRATVFIGPNDHRVLTDLRVPLFIRDAARVAVLEMAEGQLRIRFRQGEPTEIERQAIADAIDRAYADMRSSAR